MAKFQEILKEIGKGDYDNFTDAQLLSFEIMRDFKVSSTLSSYISMIFIHYKNQVCKNCKYHKEYEYEIPGAEDFTEIEVGCILMKNRVDEDFGCNRFERKDNE